MGFKKGHKINLGRKYSKEYKERLSNSHKGQIPWIKGKYHSKEAKLKMSEGHKGEHHSLKTEFKKGNIPWNKGRKMDDYPQMCYREGHKNVSNWEGKKHSENSKIKMSEARKGIYIRERCPAWQGGKSFEPYSPEFNEQFKEKIREKYNRKCAECKYCEKQLGYKLNIHHIDYNKKNNSENNLIPLCNSCHGKTGFNREDWSNHFQSNLII